MTRRDVALALSTGWPYPLVADLDDRIKVTVWELLVDQADQQR